VLIISRNKQLGDYILTGLARFSFRAHDIHDSVLFLQRLIFQMHVIIIG